MASGNLNLRDPVMYRIRKATHHRTGDTWCIYPMYDWAHGQSDSIEGVTHSLCTLEYEDHRPLYDWYLDRLGVHHPQQIEFARLNLSHTVMSKRKLLELVEAGHVSGWDDPRMPTLAGLRRRGYTPEAIRDFCERIGVAKADNLVDIAHLEHCLRDDLNKRAGRRLAVLRPLKLVIENFPEDRVEELDAVNNPEDPAMGSRKVPFSRVLYIEQDDFRETPPPKYFRLSPGKEVRLRWAYIVKCTGVVKNDRGEVVGLGRGKEMIVEPHLGRDRMGCRDPVDGPLHPSPSRIAAARSRIVRALHRRHLAGAVALDAGALHDVGVAEPHFGPRGEAEVLRGRGLAEVVLLDVEDA